VENFSLKHKNPDRVIISPDAVKRQSKKGGYGVEHGSEVKRKKRAMVLNSTGMKSEQRNEKKGETPTDSAKAWVFGANQAGKGKEKQGRQKQEKRRKQGGGGGEGQHRSSEGRKVKKGGATTT